MRIGFWGRRPSQSYFLQVYFPSVWADGEEVFREGYPMALKDPEVLQLAEALGGTELLVVQCTVLPGTFPEPKAPTIEPSPQSILFCRLWSFSFRMWPRSAGMKRC